MVNCDDSTAVTVKLCLCCINVVEDNARKCINFSRLVIVLTMYMQSFVQDSLTNIDIPIILKHSFQNFLEYVSLHGIYYCTYSDAFSKFKSSISLFPVTNLSPYDRRLLIR